MVERIDALGLRLGIDVHQQLHARLGRHPVAHGVHVLELPRRIHVKERKRRNRRMERLAREMQHHSGVLADRVKHHRALKFRRHFAQNVNALGFQCLQMG